MALITQEKSIEVTDHEARSLVECPACQAPIGEGCRTRGLGQALAGVHHRRRLAAIEYLTERQALSRFSAKILKERHEDALADTNHAYYQYHGYLLVCPWCVYQVIAKTKAKALEGMQQHYEQVLGPDWKGKVH